jgi:tetratricopeptide (TPR) repeat protein
MVKIGGKWLSRDEFKAMSDRSGVMVTQARDAIRNGRTAEAFKVLDTALLVDPQNPAALYLKGLLLYKQEQVGLARKSFEAAGASLPDHGPTLNNMAVTQWRQRAFAQALMNWEKTMAVAPLMPVVHDNLAEIFNNPPREVARTSVLKRVQTKWEAAELLLQKKMAETGMYRWGGTWVDAAQLKKLQEQEQALKTKKAELTREYTDTESKIQRMNDELAAIHRSMATLETARNLPDARTGGTGIRAPLPEAYYQMQRDEDRLVAEKKQAERKLDTLRDEAERLKGEVLVPPYRGELKIMGEEFAPNPPGNSSTTAPTTAPIAAPLDPSIP